MTKRPISTISDKATDSGRNVRPRHDAKQVEHGRPHAPRPLPPPPKISVEHGNHIPLSELSVNKDHPLRQTIRVIVRSINEKSYTKKKGGGDGLMAWAMIEDSNGMQAKITAFDKLAQKLKNLESGQRYLITKFTVGLPYYPNSAHSYDLMWQFDTKCDRYTGGDTVLPLKTTPLNLFCVSKMDNAISIIGMLVFVGPSTTANGRMRRDIFIQEDETFRIIKVTVWGKIAKLKDDEELKHYTITIINAQLNIYNGGLSLSASNVEVGDPRIHPESDVDINYFGTPIPRGTNTLSVLKDVLGLENMNYRTSLVTMSLIDYSVYWKEVCCGKTTLSICGVCQNVDLVKEYDCKVTISDSTADIEMIISDRAMHRFFGKSAGEMFNLGSDEREHIFATIKYMLCLIDYTIRYNSETGFRFYTITEIHRYNDEEFSEHLGKLVEQLKEQQKL
ncbi:hypothetical protein BC936DRAFT_148070 [Jimgerdemannia flammicorona]|uniref:Replication protein A OB domain-containing protein n=1 Tax=Jimgerdemannia flammicorona TaxID=994334 RepID=A0A433D3T2_9FUNG|nr:hypothetical protein BC936DRAFT_148070 [Jimgerdemannia flammicorona]